MGLSKMFIAGEKCRNRLFGGIEKMYDYVSATLGPHGRTILIERAAHTLEATKDGVTVANDVYSPDKWEDMGMQLVREASQRANTQAGDATTTAVVLSRNICKGGLEAVRRRANVYQISKGIKEAVKVAEDCLAKIAKTIKTKEEFKKVAAISTQDEEIGGIIASTFVDAGAHGSIDIERQDEPGIKAEKTEGISFDKGWGESTPFMAYVNERQKKRARNEDVPVLVVEKRIDNENQIMPLLEMLVEPAPAPGSVTEDELAKMIEARGGWGFGIRKLLIMCDDFSGSAVGCMVGNNKIHPEVKDRLFHLMYTKAPSYGVHKIETMKDVCAATGARFLSEDHDGSRVEFATLKDLGRAKKVIIEENKTIIVAEPTPERKKVVEERIEFIKKQLEDMAQDHLERKEYELRLATLTDGISVLKIGAESEGERHELRRRVEDGVRAVRSAREEGVTPGCGVGLLKCVLALDEHMKTIPEGDRKKGMRIVREAMHSVTLRLLEVAFIEDFTKANSFIERLLSFLEGSATGRFVTWLTGDRRAAYRRKLVEEMKENMRTGKIDNCGYDFVNDRLADMMKLGIFDAKKAVRVALQGGASCAANFLKIDGAMGEIDDEQQLIEGIRRTILNVR